MGDPLTPARCFMSGCDDVVRADDSCLIHATPEQLRHDFSAALAREAELREALADLLATSRAQRDELLALIRRFQVTRRHLPDRAWAIHEQRACRLLMGLQQTAFPAASGQDRETT